MKIRDDAVTIPGKVSRSLARVPIEIQLADGRKPLREEWVEENFSSSNTCGYRMDCS